MSVLIVKNITIEGSGTIEDYLAVEKIPYRVVDLSKGESITRSDDFDHLIVMGGPMSVKNRETYPYLKEEEVLIKRFLSKDRKILGICLGAQLLARALGAEVYPGSEEETGWYDIELTDEGLEDPCIRNLAVHREPGKMSKKIKVFHWHGETFNIPASAVRLAGSERYPNQAFRYGGNAYAFQFHVEVTKEMIYDWFRSNVHFFPQLQIETEKNYTLYHERAVKFYEVFFQGVQGVNE
jgi:GMP synthase-like glutamine amidotransferase